MYLERHASRAPRRGTSPPVVLIHGLGGDRRTWTPVVQGLTAEYDVVVVELPGFGESRPLPSSVEPSPDALAQAVLARLRSAGVQRFHAVGHGLGGWIALELGEIAGDAVISVTGLTPAGFWPHPSGERQRKAIRSARRWAPITEGETGIIERHGLGGTRNSDKQPVHKLQKREIRMRHG
eukprot:TRINITY_DN12881_c0_g1_i2.p1 TRINITY_DN12881_c0_g1~~TRINITY_DN12881_c0_g1_i2.p1  ORF type:complete len:189 (+),score=24.05 TRINITY_DN12881_c0_g1_i2:30-569(+)